MADGGDSIAKAYIDIYARDHSGNAVEKSLQGLHALVAQNEALAASVRAVNQERAIEARHAEQLARIVERTRQETVRRSVDAVQSEQRQEQFAAERMQRERQESIRNSYAAVQAERDQESRNAARMAREQRDSYDSTVAKSMRAVDSERAEEARNAERIAVANRQAAEAADRSRNAAIATSYQAVQSERAEEARHAERIAVANRQAAEAADRSRNAAIATSYQAVQSERAEEERRAAEMAANAERQRAEALSFSAGATREADAITQRYLTDLERLEQEQIRLNQLWETGALNTTTFSRANADINTRRAGLMTPPALPGALAAERDANLLRAQAIDLVRQQASAQELHNSRIATYDRMLRLNLITEQQHAVAIRRSADAMRSQTGGVRGDFAFQASYAIQDIATISQMQGMRMADYFRAASNNVSQMMFAIKGLSPAMIGLAGAGVAVGAALVPVVWEAWTQGAKKAEEATDRQTKALERLQKALQRVADESGRQAKFTKDLTASPQQLQEGITDSLREETMRREQARVAETMRRQMEGELRRNTAFAEAAFAGGAGGTQTRAIRLGLLREGVDVRNADEVQTALRNRIATTDDATMRASLQQFLDQYTSGLGTLIGRNDGLKKAIDEQIEAQKKARDATEERAHKERELARHLADFATREALTLQQAQFEQRRSDREKRQSVREDLRRMMRDSDRSFFVSQGFSTDAIEESRQRISEFQRTLESMPGGDPNAERKMDDFLFQERTRFKQQIEDEKDGMRAPSRFSGFGDFGREFQMQLLKVDDKEAQRHRDKIKLMENFESLLGQIAAKTDSAGTRFGP